VTLAVICRMIAWISLYISSGDLVVVIIGLNHNMRVNDPSTWCHDDHTRFTALSTHTQLDLIYHVRGYQTAIAPRPLLCLYLL
jgi:hypothetical protein